MSPYLLPPTLMDLTISRMCSSSVMRRNLPLLKPRSSKNLSSSCRMFEALATAAAPPSSQFPENGSYAALHGRKRHGRQYDKSLAVRKSAKSVNSLLAEFERRVEALDEVVQSEGASTEPLAYTEADLISLYEDILAIPETQVDQTTNLERFTQLQAQEDAVIIKATVQRFEELKGDLGSFESTKEGFNENRGEEISVTCRRILKQARGQILHIETLRASVLKTQDFDSSLPISVLSIRESEAFVRASIQAGDMISAEMALDIMKRTGLPISLDAVTNMLGLYANIGDVYAAEQVLHNYTFEAPKEQLRHLHVKAHLKATPYDQIPFSALEVLHSYENEARPAPLKSYTAVISSLFQKSSPIARAQAWDLFSHMRYVAHPNPDTYLYSLVIRACATPLSPSISSEPEKALDFWTEMTIDHKLSPTVDAYNAVILACARSGNRKYVNEAFRIARQMLDSHRDARGRSEFKPHRNTFCALLEGAKRMGDLGRARWILAEMIKGQRLNGNQMNGPTESWIDEEVMTHIFHAYASYRPPFIRTATLIKGGVAESAQSQQAKSQSYKQAQIERDSTGSTHPLNSIAAGKSISASFAHIPPQSREEVIGEVEYLFQRIIAETGPSQTSEHHHFKDVKFTSRLLNAYLSVYYRHASLGKSRELFWTLHDKLDLLKTGHVYVEALERCGNLRRDFHRTATLQFAQEVWQKWRTVEQSGVDGRRVLSARLIERAHIAMIKVLSLTKNLDQAMDHIRTFATQYPPTAVRTPAPKPTLRSTRTILIGARPLVRLTSTTEVPDDAVPPLIMFSDIEFVHHQLVADERKKDIGYLTWLCKSYEFALRTRRNQTMKADPLMKPTAVQVQSS